MDVLSNTMQIFLVFKMQHGNCDSFSKIASESDLLLKLGPKHSKVTFYNRKRFKIYIYTYFFISKSRA